jgi:hypothetical protein
MKGSARAAMAIIGRSRFLFGGWWNMKPFGLGILLGLLLNALVFVGVNL